MAKRRITSLKKLSRIKSKPNQSVEDEDIETTNVEIVKESKTKVFNPLKKKGIFDFKY